MRSMTEDWILSFSLRVSPINSSATVCDISILPLQTLDFRFGTNRPDNDNTFKWLRFFALASQEMPDARNLAMNDRAVGGVTERTGQALMRLTRSVIPPLKICL